MSPVKFNEAAKDVMSTYGYVCENNGDYIKDTRWGKLRVYFTKSMKTGYFIFMRFVEAEKFSMPEFKAVYSEFDTPNEHTLKWNLTSVDAEYALLALDERLSSIDYLKDNYEKILKELECC